MKKQTKIKQKLLVEIIKINYPSNKMVCKPHYNTESLYHTVCIFYWTIIIKKFLNCPNHYFLVIKPADKRLGIHCGLFYYCSKKHPQCKLNIFKNVLFPRKLKTFSKKEYFCCHESISALHSCCGFFKYSQNQ